MVVSSHNIFQKELILFTDTAELENPMIEYLKVASKDRPIGIKDSVLEQLVEDAFEDIRKWGKETKL